MYLRRMSERNTWMYVSRPGRLLEPRFSWLLGLLLALSTACGSAPIPDRQARTSAEDGSAASQASASTPSASQGAGQGDRASAARELAARLQYLEKQLEAARVESHVPGMAVAVVKDDKVVMARGFGVSDRASNKPVTAETIFAIGSTSKAFTATAAGMVIDDGKLSWDDPLSKHTPLALKIQAPAGAPRKATLRDALCHRTGYPRMSLLWVAGALSRDEMMQYASRAVPSAELGAKFQYNNVMYMVAGEVVGRAAGTTWEALVRERILAPLGMTSTTLSITDAQKDHRLARGYTYWADSDVYLDEAMRNLDTIGPAGSINSNVIDMAKWVRLQLGGGQFEGKRLISQQQLAEIHRGQISMGQGASYALGWMIFDWNGQRHLQHGGNIDGFAASVGFAPDSGVGYVLLSNLGATPLQQTVGPMVFDALLTDAYKGQKTGGDGNFAPFVGKYVANFGPFSDQRFTVLVKDGALAVDVPGQQVFALKPPDAEGKRHFAITSTIAVSFQKDAAGQVVGMVLHQGGLDLELPREGAPVTGTVDFETAAPLLGDYENTGNQSVPRVTLVMDGGRLAVDVPGQMKFQLRPPDGEGRWRLRAKSDYYLTFQRDKASKVTGLTLFQDGKELPYKRLASDKKKGEPMTLARIRALRKSDRREKALAGFGLAVMEGKVKMPNQGVEGTVTIYFTADRYRQEIDFGRLGKLVTVATPEGAWTSLSFDEPRQLDGRLLTQARVQHPMALFTDWKEHFDKIELTGSEERDGRTVHRLRLQAGELPPMTIQVDGKTGDVTRVDTQQVHYFGGFPHGIAFSDFRVVRGLRVPYKLTIDDWANGTIEYQVTRIRTRLPKSQARDRFPAQLPEQ